MRKFFVGIAIVVSTCNNPAQAWDNDCPSAETIRKIVQESCKLECPTANPAPTAPTTCVFPPIIFPDYETCLSQGDNRPEKCPQPNHRRRILKPIVE